MKFTFATPTFPPDIGGPAIYSQKLKEGLSSRSHAVEAVSYAGLKNIPQPLRMFFYTLALFQKNRGSDLIYSFNLISCGLPAWFVSRILRKKFFIRIGGDFLWERAVEAGRTGKPLREYYDGPKTMKEKFWIFVIKKVFAGADKIIFTSVFQRDIYLRHFKLAREKTAIIQNPFPEVDSVADEPAAAGRQILYAGRLLKLKKLDSLANAFRAVLPKSGGDLFLKIVGEGPERNNLESKIKNLGLSDHALITEPLSHLELLKEIKKSYLCVLPSLTEITPNFALECLKLRKPILLTKETGYYDDFKNELVFIDPRDEADLARKIAFLLDGKNYLDYIEKIKTIPTQRSWDDVIKEHEESFIHRGH